MEDCEQLAGFFRASLVFFTFARYFSQQTVNVNLMLVQSHNLSFLLGYYY